MNIRSEKIGDGVILTMDWQERANALSYAMAQALADAVDDALAAGARVLAITAAGRVFCSGGQLDDPLPEDAGAILEEVLNPLLLKLAALNIPLITGVNGPAIGAGASLALAGDIVIAARSAWLSFAFGQVGLSCDAGASWLLPRAIGWHRAMSLMMLGERLTAPQALEWGLVTRLVEDDQLGEDVAAILNRLAAGPTRSYGLIRRLSRQALNLSFAQALDAEREGQRIAGQTVDFQEGVTAFRERRAPLFQGR